MSHTPTPWKINKQDTGMNDSGTIEGGGIIIVPDVYGESKERADGNAAHIVRCVNNHDALLQALKTVIDVTTVYHRNDTTGRPWLKQALDAIQAAEA